MSVESDNYVTWKYESSELLFGETGFPIAFDVVDKTPWIVLPVRAKQCVQFDFPREGLVFFRLEGKEWRTVPYDKSPPDLRVNLLRNREAYKNGSGMERANCEFGTYDQFRGFACKPNPKTISGNEPISVGPEGVFYSPKESTMPINRNYGRAVTPKIRQYLDAQLKKEGSGARYITVDGSGKMIKEIVKANLASSDHSDNESCAHIHPLPDPKFAAALQLNIEAERNAKTVVVDISAATDSPEIITRDGYQKSRGRWTGVGYLSNKCVGIVKYFEQLRQYDDHGGFHSTGAQLILNNDEKIPAKEFGFVTCENSSIYTVSRQLSKDEILVYRYTYSGELIDVTRFVLPSTPDTHSFNSGGDLWGFTTANDRVVMTIADYSYESTANLGGTVRKKVTYTAGFPRK
jgi:hypothetical protein